ncbi:MAG: PIN domain-containing protein [Methylococcaceae bacterium]|nr:PIN domain-containing protein [Methylococcaceae bacterium]
MKLLLDTHTLIWLAEADSNLSQAAKSAIEDPENICFVSLVSFWEMAIKTSLGKLDIQTPLDQLKQLIIENGMEILPIEIEHTLLVAKLPFHHKDPFDRLLIAQASIEKMTLLSKDEKFSHYDIQLLW